jgi:FMN phosphatase YigB (HAD superfamily)
MRIAFDLDNTLIPCGYDFPLEKSAFQVWQKWWQLEKLRLGTIELFKFLQKNRHETWIYTSSGRNEWYIRHIFWMYQLDLQGVVNYQKHYQKIKNANLTASKYPPFWNIDLLIDDALGVEMEGKKLGFKTLIISPEDENWVERIKNIITT